MEVPGRLVTDSALTYAYGVSVETWRGVREVSHTGATGGFRSALFRYPAQHTSVALLCNVSTANTTTLAHRVAEIVLGSALSPVVRASAAASALPSAVRADSVRAITPAQREAFSGRWYSEELDVTWEIRDVERGGLQLLVPRRPVRLLRALGDDTLGVGELQLVRESADVFTLNAGRVRGVRFERVRGP
jgi:CubicO group peptidase (beta-lactamase class C family)